MLPLITALLLSLGCFVASLGGAAGRHPVHPEARLMARIFFGGGFILLGLSAWLAI